MFLEILKAILMGIVEGITEWLPISSTGHMILVEQVVKFNASEEFMSMFRVVIQLGAILAVVVLFWGKLWPVDEMGSHSVMPSTMPIKIALMISRNI